MHNPYATLGLEGWSGLSYSPTAIRGNQRGNWDGQPGSATAAATTRASTSMLNGLHR
jgi:hypothetical protein